MSAASTDATALGAHLGRGRWRVGRSALDDLALLGLAGLGLGGGHGDGRDGGRGRLALDLDRVLFDGVSGRDGGGVRDRGRLGGSDSLGGLRGVQRASA